MDAITEKTPCGRIAFVPLRNPRHEALAHATVQGKTGRAAGLDAGFKDGPGLKGNIARLRQRPEIIERIAELAERSADLAEIYDGWVLADVRLFAKANPADFFKRDAAGKIICEDGIPVLDFSNATEDQFRTLEEFSYSKTVTKDGADSVDDLKIKVKVRDPVQALDKLMRHRGLMRDKVALTDPSGKESAEITLVTMTTADRARALAAFVARTKAEKNQSA